MTDLLFIEQMKKIQQYILNVIDNESHNEENLFHLLQDLQITKDPANFKLFLSLLVSITNNHSCTYLFITKIKKILQHYVDEIQKYYFNDEIYYIFSKNRFILLFLIENKIIKINQNIISFMLTDYTQTKNLSYFYTEIKDIIDFNSNNIPQELQKFKPPENFSEKRRNGENDDSEICELIRNDKIDEFTTYVNKNQYSLNSNISQSLFETNSLLLSKKSVSLIEYASFYGSIQIFKYLYYNKVQITQSLWIYGIHGNNLELIHILEENKISPVDQNYIECFTESIKCHHNDIANYILNNYIDENKMSNDEFAQFKKQILKTSFQYNNYYFLPKDFYKNISFLYDSENIIEFEINSMKKGLKEVINRYSFHHYLSMDELDINLNKDIIQKLKESEVLIINQNKEFYIIGFKDTILIIKQSLKFKLQNFLWMNKKIPTYVISKDKNIFDLQVNIEKDHFLDEEINNFNDYIKDLIKQKSGPSIKKLKMDILSCLSGYLIRESYIKLKKEQIDSYNFLLKNGDTVQKDIKNSIQNLEENEYIEIRNIGNGASSEISLIYHIENGELFAIKKVRESGNEYEKLKNRENDNYSNLNFPFLPKYYGKVRNKDYPIFQFIKGETLDKYMNKYKLDDKDKITIIFEIMIVINYFHKNQFIYRDLKPNNIIIDENKIPFVIDFDRMIKTKDINDVYTVDLSSPFVAPEVNIGQSSYQSDIYSIGKIIFYMMFDKQQKSQLKNLDKLYQIYKRCTNTNPKERPSEVSLLMFEFFLIFNSEINFSLINNFSDVYFFVCLYYCQDNMLKQDINKAIKYYLYASNQNIIRAQFILGQIYLKGKFVMQDINKSIYYFTLASNQNDAKAQYNLGYIYYSNRHIAGYMPKAIYYYSLAADQDLAEAQYNIGVFYLDGIYIQQDIKKGIHLITISADKNYLLAQYSIGTIYYEHKYIKQDIPKAIHYLTLAADRKYALAQFCLGVIYNNINKDYKKAIHYIKLAADQNLPQAQFNLGKIYEDGVIVNRDMQKSIQYYLLAANQNYSSAQFNLGNIYYFANYVKRDIDKAIYYFELAASQNLSSAQFILGCIYSKNNNKMNINKAIYYYSLASNQNDVESQYQLGDIYCNDKYGMKDINKAIYYYSLAAKQNFSQAQYKLGEIYYSDKFGMKDIKNAIRCFSIAAKQNFFLAQYQLGHIYYNGEYVSRDIDKSIHYFSLAANQNHAVSQFNLGVIFSCCKYIPRDINKAIHYFELAANQNNSDAQHYLGIIYLNDKEIQPDYDKAIHYLTLSANQNNASSQHALGCVYYINHDFKKSIYFFTSAANQNHAKAQLTLSSYYFNGKYTKQDINKAIFYISSSAKLNNSIAQFKLGNIYMNGKYVEKNFIKGLDLINQSALNGNPKADFAIAYFYYIGKLMPKDVNKSIHHYKNASSFNNQYAKNNLGFIYINMNDKDDIGKNVGIAISYFEEAIKRFNDKLSMYNLSIILIYNDKTNEAINRSIDLLVKSSKQGFQPASNLLCIVLIMKYGFNFDKIMQELKTKTEDYWLLYNVVLDIIKSENLYDDAIFKLNYQYYKTNYYMYDNIRREIPSNLINDKDSTLSNNRKENCITADFYEGFGYDILKKE